MAGRHLVFWNIDSDVIVGPGDGEIRQDYRTIVCRSSDAPRPSRPILCVGIDPDQRTPAITAIGRVLRKRGVSTGRSSVRVEPFWILKTPIDVVSLDGKLDHHVTRALDEAIARDALSPKEFTARSGEAIWDAVGRSSPEAADLLTRLQREPVRIAGLDGMRLREERDAVATSLQLAGISMQDEMFPQWADPIEDGEAFGASIHPDFVMDLEDDLIAADLVRFDSQASLRRIAGSAAVITDTDVRLTVINVNRKSLEKVHGVDLVYYDHINDQATAVQYKRLQKIAVSGPGSIRSDWIFRRKTELEKQLELMRQQPRPGIPSSADWRLSPSPNFFKFVRTDAFDPDGKSLLKGMYVPSDYLRLGIQDGSFNTGSRGGFRIGYHNTRYFTSDVFVQLVRRGWIGTSKTDKSSIGRMVAQLAREHEVILALRDRIS